MIKNKHFQLFLFSATIFAAHLFFAADSINAQTDVTLPGNSITIVNGQNDGDGDSGPPPAGEGVANAIDNTTNKYLNFLDFNSGFIVVPNGSSRVTGIRIYTANDESNRDPASYRLEGSNNGGTTWTLISAGAINLPAGRNATGQAITTPGLNSATVNFTNLVFYTRYRLIFPTLKNAAAANSMQIGEAELLGTFQATAAPVTIGGRVLLLSKRGISYARVSLTNPNGEVRTTLTNSFGFFRFFDVPAGETYIFEAHHKRYSFPAQVLTINDETDDLNFLALP